MKKKIAFIVNPRSGTGNKLETVRIIERYLDKDRFDAIIEFTTERGDGKRMAREFAGKDYHAVIAVGGDGTVNEIGQSLIHTNTAMGIIPVGSGNGLARHLGIPLNVKSAVQLINNSETILADYGLVNSQPFFCTCGTGFDAYVSTEFAKGKQRGIMSYLEKVITGIFNYRPIDYQLEGENIELKGKAFVVTFANASQWGNNFFIAPNASIQDGMLDISILSQFPIIALPSISLKLFTKTIDKDFFMTTLRTGEIVMKRSQPGPFHYDGEPYEEGTEIHVCIVSDGLKVLVKKRF